MSASDLSRDDAEPPSRRLQFSLRVADGVPETQLPHANLMQRWVWHALASSVKPDSQLHYEVSLSVVGLDEIQALNRDYRDRDTPTNVLSFPANMPALPGDEGTESLQPLGDIVICHDVVVSEALAQQKTTEQHWAHMLIHSVLHLLGHDHIDSDEATLMESLEVSLLAELSIPNPYQVSFET